MPSDVGIITRLRPTSAPPHTGPYSNNGHTAEGIILHKTKPESGQQIKKHD